MRARVLLLLGLLVAGEGLRGVVRRREAAAERAWKAVLGRRAHVRTARTPASPASLRPPRTVVGPKGSFTGSRRAHAGCGSLPQLSAARSPSGASGAVSVLSLLPSVHWRTSTLETLWA